MFLLLSNLSGIPPLTTLGIPLRSWQPFRSLQTKLAFLVILPCLDMRLFSVKADFSPPPQILEISLSGKEESDVANSIAKMTRQRTPGYFHPYARWNQPQHFGARGVSSRGARRGVRACGICFNCGQRGHLKNNCTSS